MKTIELTADERDDLLQVLRARIMSDLSYVLKMRVQGSDELAPKYVNRAARLRALVYKID